MFFNQYPYLNLNDLNLDYIMKAIKEMRYEVTNFVSINAIKYADPIQWNITSQYEKNTIVIDPVTGTAYISVAPVPAGVALTRPEYWTVVFDLGSFVTKAAQNFTSHYESNTTTTATFNSNAGDWLVWGDVLYKALVNITAGDTYVVGSNIEHFTIEDLYNAYLNTVASILAMVGNLVDLTTTDKTSIVNAINSVVALIGNLNNLATIDKTDIVSAINEIVGNVTNNTHEINVLNTTRSNGLSYDCDTIVTKFNYIDTLTGSVDPYNLQGCCYNSNDDTILLLFVGINDATKAIGVKVDGADGITVILRKQLDNTIGHANDVTYNPTTNRYYVAYADFSGLTSDDKIVVLNGTTLDFIEDVMLSATQIDPNDCPSLITYNSDDDVYIVGSYYKFRTYDASFNLLNTVNYTLLLENNDNFGVVSAVRQGMIYKDGRVILNIGTFSDFNGNHIYDGKILVTIDYENGTVVTSYPLRQSHATAETEGIVDIDGVYYILSQGYRTYTIDKVISQLIPSRNVGVNLFDGGAVLPDGIDFDDIIKVGKYCTMSGATYSNAFCASGESVVFVISGYLENLIQIQLQYAGVGGGSVNLYIVAGMRVYTPSISGWSKWYPIGNSNRPSNGQIFASSGGIVPCYVANNSKDLVVFLPTKSNYANPTGLSISGKLECFVGGYRVRDINDANPDNGRIELSTKNVVFNSVTDEGTRIIVRNTDDSAWVNTNGATLQNYSSFNALFVNLVMSKS